MTRTLGHGTSLQQKLQMIQNWEEASDTQDGCAAIHSRLQKWVGRNLMKLKKKFKILAPGTD